MNLKMLIDVTLEPINNRNEKTVTPKIYQNVYFMKKGCFYLHFFNNY